MSSYVKFIFSLYLCLVVLLQEIYEVKCKSDDLQFWTRDPKYWIRQNDKHYLDSLRLKNNKSSRKAHDVFLNYGPQQNVRAKKGNKRVTIKKKSDVEAWPPKGYKTNYKGEKDDYLSRLRFEIADSNLNINNSDRNKGQDYKNGDQSYNKMNQNHYKNDKGSKAGNKKGQNYNNVKQNQNKGNQDRIKKNQKRNKTDQDRNKRNKNQNKKGQDNNQWGQNYNKWEKIFKFVGQEHYKGNKDRNKGGSEYNKGGQTSDKEDQNRFTASQDYSKEGQDRNKDGLGRNKSGKIRNENGKVYNEEHGQNEDDLYYDLDSQEHSTVGPDFNREDQNSKEDKVRSKESFFGADSINDNKYLKHKQLDIEREGIMRPNYSDENVPESRERHKSKNEKKNIIDDSKEIKKRNKKSQLRMTTGKSFQTPLRSTKKNKKILRTNNLKKIPDDDISGELYEHSIARQLLCLQKRITNFSSINNADIEQQIIGRTENYYDIVLWKIKEKENINARHKFRALDNHKYEDEVIEKKIIFIVHGLSVMGWHKLPCLSVVSEFQILLSYYLENLDSFDIFLVPMANPDGVMASRRYSYWNKNQSPQGECPGVALDRNFDVGWNVSKKFSTCNQQYPGTSPFSERESRAIREVFHLYGNKITAYFHVHSGTHDNDIHKGDAILYPRGYTEAQSDDDKYIDLKGELEEAMKNASFKMITVTVDTLHNWYGSVAGTSVDYASTIYGIPYALEFVMQLYINQEQESFKRTQDFALTELWQVLIDVTFDHIYRSETKRDNNN